MTRPPKLLLVLVFVFVGASNPIAIKFALESGWPVLPLGIARMGSIGLFFLLWVLAVREHPIGNSAAGRRLSLMAAGCKGIGVIAFYMALFWAPANRVIVLSAFSPVVALLMIDRMLEHEKVERRQWLGVGTSFLGLVLLLSLRGELAAAGSESWRMTHLGDACMIVSVIFHTAMVVYEKKAMLEGVNPRQLIVSTNLVSIAVFVVIALALDDSGFRSIPTTAKAGWAFVYLVSVVGVFFFYYRRWMVGVLDLGYIASFSHFGRAIALVYAAVLLGETIPLSNLGAFAFILLGSMIANRSGTSLVRVSPPN